MSYTPTIWHDNDDITAVKLNKIENEIANQYINNIFYSWPTYEEVQILLDKDIIPIVFIDGIQYYILEYYTSLSIGSGEDIVKKLSAGDSTFFCGYTAYSFFNNQYFQLRASNSIAIPTYYNPAGAAIIR